MLYSIHKAEGHCTNQKGKIMNLFLETKEALTDEGYIWPDSVNYISIYDFQSRAERSIPFDLFEEKANRYYDSGYGAQEVDPTLKIVMNDGSYYDRGEYDGSEWWEHHPVVKKDAPPRINGELRLFCF